MKREAKEWFSVLDDNIVHLAVSLAIIGATCVLDAMGRIDGNQVLGLFGLAAGIGTVGPMSRTILTRPTRATEVAERLVSAVKSTNGEHT